MFRKYKTPDFKEALSKSAVLNLTFGILLNEAGVIFIKA